MQLTETLERAAGRRAAPSRLWRSLLGSTNAISTTELALVLPVFMIFGMYGTELAYMQTVNMQLGQLATSTADNASRIGQTNNTAVTPTVSEQDINSVMFGARKQGATYRFNENGRLILTSLEVDPATNKQWIRWQRCTGTRTAYTSAYGNDTSQNGLNGPVIPGLGRYSKITADSGKSVMYVEVIYQYRGLFGTMFVGNPVMRKEAAFITRDNRNLTTGVTGAGGAANCT